MVSGLGFGGSGFRVKSLEFRAQGLEFRVYGLRVSPKAASARPCEGGPVSAELGAVGIFVLPNLIQFSISPKPLTLNPEPPKPRSLKPRP